MSTSLSPRSSGSVGGSGHPTRQQLDELDALLQRMLALPVNQAEDVTAEINAASKTTATLRQEPVSYRTAEYGDEPSTSVDNETAGAKPKSPPRLDDAHVSSSGEAKEDTDSWVPLSSTWKPSPQTWKPLAQSWQQPRTPPLSKPTQESPPSREEPVGVAAPTPPPTVPIVTAKPGPPAPVVPKAPASAVLAPIEPPVPQWLRPILWFNVAFDFLLLPWGPPGRWLRRDGGGRSLLGVVGILLLAAAVGLSVLQWFGWTWNDLVARIL